MRDVMLDIETLGCTPGSGVIAVGAVAFDPIAGTVGQEFHAILNRASNLAAGLTEDPGTLAWWEEQSAAARDTLVISTAAGGQDLLPGLQAFTAWFRGVDPDPEAVRVWGNGSDFDQPLLFAAYRAAGLEHPWPFYNNRCYRTLKGFVPHDKIVRDGLVHHNALDDARAQAIHAIKLLKKVYARAE